MQYLSTRDPKNPPERLPFDQVLLAGLARDGGLYVPESWPRLELRSLVGKSYAQIATAVMSPFLSGTIEPDTFRGLVERAYRGFDHAAVAPLKQLENNLWLLELFHGPTLAFKDYALQLVGLLFDHVLTRARARVST